MFAGASVALFVVVVALIGAMGALAFVLGIGATK